MKLKELLEGKKYTNAGERISFLLDLTSNIKDIERKKIKIKDLITDWYSNFVKRAKDASAIHQRRNDLMILLRYAEIAIENPKKMNSVKKKYNKQVEKIKQRIKI